MKFNVLLHIITERAEFVFTAVTLLIYVERYV